MTTSPGIILPLGQLVPFDEGDPGRFLDVLTPWRVTSADDWMWDSRVTVDGDSGEVTLRLDEAGAWVIDSFHGLDDDAWHGVQVVRLCRRES